VNKIENPLVTCLCCTYNRPILLGESIKCFLDQDYKNKQLIILNDQEGVELVLDNCPKEIAIVNIPIRFGCLGEKRNFIHSLFPNSEYYCIFDDDDIYVPYRLSESVDLMKINPQYDIIKPKDSFISFDNTGYKLATNRFHSQAIIRKEFMDNNSYPLISLGEDAVFEKNANVGYIEMFPNFWSVFRYGMETYHLSSVNYPSLEKEAWENAGKNSNLKGTIKIEPKFQKDYWAEMKDVLNKINGFAGYEFYDKIGRKI
jgi:glycosyltransferase involved in cell wall biosynthesis